MKDWWKKINEKVYKNNLPTELMANIVCVMKDDVVDETGWKKICGNQKNVK